MGSILQDSATGDVVVVGFPFDEGTVRNGGRGGGKGGPAAFRKFMPKLGCAVNPEYGVDITGLKLGDAGDAVGSTIEEAHTDLTKRVRGIIEAGGVPFVVGGSNDQSYANARGLIEATTDGTKISAINIDAHFVSFVLCGRPSAGPHWLDLTHPPTHRMCDH